MERKGSFAYCKMVLGGLKERAEAEVERVEGWEGEQGGGEEGVRGILARLVLE